MEQSIKEIVAPFLKKEPTEIHKGTSVDNKAVQSSILIHRMYAELSANGFTVDDYSTIRTFGDLMSKLGQAVTDDVAGSNGAVDSSRNLKPGIGVDIVHLEQLPDTFDYWEEPFYTENFAKSEIAHCLTKKHPKQSFAGLFAAKEAAIKVNTRLKHMKFNSIVIVIDESGKPSTQDINLSISHTEKTAVAVAISESALTSISEDPKEEPVELQGMGEVKPARKSKLAWLALLVALFTFFVVLVYIILDLFILQ